MGTEYFRVYVNEDLVGEYMPLQFALILTKAIYSEFYAEPKLKVTIQKMQLEVEAGAENDDEE